MERPTAVSYTHLDVYKRQAQYGQVHIFFHLRKTYFWNLDGIGAECEVPVKKYCESTFAAVSYTHLDVYKRQIFTSLLLERVDSTYIVKHINQKVNIKNN